MTLTFHLKLAILISYVNLNSFVKLFFLKDSVYSKSKFKKSILRYVEFSFLLRGNTSAKMPSIVNDTTEISNNLTIQ